MAETSTPTYTIRHATESDVPAILGMIQELAVYEKALHEVQATETSLLDSLCFPSDPTKGYAKTLLIFPHDSSGTGSSSSAAGMALYFHNYSTWRSRPGIYLEDLYVKAEYRGRGLGKALLQALAREAVAKKCGRLEWSVLKWNRPSIDFYESEAVGATMMEEWVGMRVDGEKLTRLAAAGGQEQKDVSR